MSVQVKVMLPEYPPLPITAMAEVRLPPGEMPSDGELAESVNAGTPTKTVVVCVMLPDVAATATV